MDFFQLTKDNILDYLPARYDEEDYLAVANTDWLSDKLDRKRSLQEHLKYCQDFFPELFNIPLFTALDMGPGGGTLLEILRVCGYKILGVDTPIEVSTGMGSGYVRVCEFLWEKQSIPVHRMPGLEFLDGSVYPNELGLINFRGSFEQIFVQHFDEPFVQHSTPRSWVLDKSCKDSFYTLFDFATESLLDGGVLMLACNGSKNHKEMKKLLKICAAGFPLSLEIEEERNLKWKLST